MTWPLAAEDAKSETVIDTQGEYPADDAEFAGLYGYNLTYTHAGFLNDSNRYYLISSEMKGQERIYIADVESKQVKMLRLADSDKTSRVGNYTLLRKFKDLVLLKYSELNVAPQIHAVRFQNTATAQNLDELLAKENLNFSLIEKLDLEADKSEFGEFFSEGVKSYKQDFIKLENGAEAYFQRRGDLDPEKKHPMIVLIHGGPFSSAPHSAFLIMRNFLLLQGYTLLVLNYRGSIGFGENTMNTLLGTIG